MAKSTFRKVNFLIGLQYLITRRKQSILAAAGVALGVSTFIVMISFMTGVNTFLDDAVLGGNPDIIIRKKSSKETFETAKGSDQDGDLSQIVASALQQDFNVRATAPQVISPAIIIGESEGLPVGLNGVFPEKERLMVDLDRRLTQGSGFGSLKDHKSILLGVSLAKRLGVSEGNTVQIILPTGNRVQLKVMGIFSFGITTIDNLRAYVHAQTLQNLLGKKAELTHVHIRLKDRNAVESTSAQLQNIKLLTTEDWKAANKTIVVGNQVRNVLTWSISLALLLVAGFGIYNILNSTVIQKRKDIAVLKTMGYNRKDVVFIFLIQSFIIGFTGALLGGIIGYLGSYLISNTPLETTDFIIVETYPVSFRVIHYILGISFGLLAAVLAGYFPSKKASRVDPVTIVRGL